MAPGTPLIRPRLADYHGVTLTQEDADCAIPRDTPQGFGQIRGVRDYRPPERLIKQRIIDLSPGQRWAILTRITAEPFDGFTALTPLKLVDAGIDTSEVHVVPVIDRVGIVAHVRFRGERVTRVAFHLPRVKALRDIARIGDQRVAKLGNERWVVGIEPLLPGLVSLGRVLLRLGNLLFGLEPRLCCGL